MQLTNVLNFNVKWNYKNIILFLVLLGLPNLLGMLNIATPWGFKLHFFQLAIFIAAAIYGPKGGALSGLLGSLYSAAIMHNPYIIIGNIILGFFVGLFIRYKINTVIAVILAYAVQLPWLLLTDYYLVHLPIPFLKNLVIALFVSNVIWAILINYSFANDRTRFQ